MTLLMLRVKRWIFSSQPHIVTNFRFHKRHINWRKPKFPKIFPLLAIFQQLLKIHNLDSSKERHGIGRAGKMRHSFSDIRDNLISLPNKGNDTSFFSKTCSERSGLPFIKNIKKGHRPVAFTLGWPWRLPPHAQRIDEKMESFRSADFCPTRTKKARTGMTDWLMAAFSFVFWKLERFFGIVLELCLEG